MYDQKFNAAVLLMQQRALALRGIKKIIKPIIKAIKKKQELKKASAEFQQQNDCNSSLEDMRKDPVSLEATDDNAANEALEERLHEELRQCPADAAILIHQGQADHIIPVHNQQKFIPVHFARTSNGTFFWTSMHITRYQEQMLRPQLDRWGQA